MLSVLQHNVCLIFNLATNLARIQIHSFHILCCQISAMKLNQKIWNDVPTVFVLGNFKKIASAGSRIARVTSSEELGTMSKNNLRGITLSRQTFMGDSLSYLDNLLVLFEYFSCIFPENYFLYFIQENEDLTWNWKKKIKCQPHTAEWRLRKRWRWWNEELKDRLDNNLLV